MEVQQLEERWEKLHNVLLISMNIVNQKSCTYHEF